MHKRLACVVFLVGSTLFGNAQASASYTLNLTIGGCSGSGSGSGSFCAAFDNVPGTLVMTIPDLQSQYYGGAFGSTESLSSDQASIRSPFASALLSRSRAGASFDGTSFYLGLTSPTRDLDPYPHQAFSLSKESTAYFETSSGPRFESYGLSVNGTGTFGIDPASFDSSGVGGLLGVLAPFSFSAYFVSGAVGGSPLERDAWVSIFGTATYAMTPLPPVPEPATWALLLAGLGVTGALARRRGPAGLRPLAVG